jgi:hypothetical protein
MSVGTLKNRRNRALVGNSTCNKGCYFSGRAHGSNRQAGIVLLHPAPEDEIMKARRQDWLSNASDTSVVVALVTLSVGACMTLIVASQTISFIWLLIFALSVGVGMICDIKMQRRAKV